MVKVSHISSCHNSLQAKSLNLQAYSSNQLTGYLQLVFNNYSVILSYIMNNSCKSVHFQIHSLGQLVKDEHKDAN